MVVGPRVGRTTSKEQYVFFYRYCVAFLMGHFDLVISSEKSSLSVLAEEFKPNCKFLRIVGSK